MIKIDFHTLLVAHSFIERCVKDEFNSQINNDACVVEASKGAFCRAVTAVETQYQIPHELAFELVAEVTRLVPGKRMNVTIEGVNP